MPKYKLVFKEEAYAYGEIVADSVEAAFAAVLEDCELSHATPVCEQDPVTTLRIIDAESGESSEELLLAM